MRLLQSFLSISFIALILLSCKSRVSITDGIISENQECFKITTPSATYIYQKEAGGFSNIFDANGTDWIQFHRTDTAGYPHSSTSDYRGLPNLVFGSLDGGCGHPGFDKMTSEQVSENQIRSTSKSGIWQWLWIFHEKYAELIIEKTDPEYAYWFLYEGPIAGRFSPLSHYWGTDMKGPLMLKPDLIKGSEQYGNWQTVYFGDEDYGQILFLKQMEADSLQDHYAYMGNTNEGNSSKDGMVVFGFGRAKGANPLMIDKHRFIIGFFDGRIMDESEHTQFLKYINQISNK